jgi:hypothetical protein
MEKRLLNQKVSCRKKVPDEEMLLNQKGSCQKKVPDEKRFLMNKRFLTKKVPDEKKFPPNGGPADLYPQKLQGIQRRGARHSGTTGCGMCLPHISGCVFRFFSFLFLESDKGLDSPWHCVLSICLVLWFLPVFWCLCCVLSCLVLGSVYFFLPFIKVFI